MRHEPSGLVGHAKRAVELMGADALLAGAYEMRSEHPLVQRDFAALEHCADRDGELRAAVAAEIQARTMGLTLEKAIARYPTAMRTNRAIRPAYGFQMAARCVVVGETYF